MTSQPWKQTVVIHIFPNNSRSTGSQTMKYREKYFCPKIMQNMRLGN